MKLNHSQTTNQIGYCIVQDKRHIKRTMKTKETRNCSYKCCIKMNAFSPSMRKCKCNACVSIIIGPLFRFQPPRIKTRSLLRIILIIEITSKGKHTHTHAHFPPIELDRLKQHCDRVQFNETGRNRRTLWILNSQCKSSWNIFSFLVYFLFSLFVEQMPVFCYCYQKIKYM